MLTPLTQRLWHSRNRASGEPGAVQHPGHSSCAPPMVIRSSGPWACHRTRCSRPVSPAMCARTKRAACRRAHNRSPAGIRGTRETRTSIRHCTAPADDAPLGSAPGTVRVLSLVRQLDIGPSCTVPPPTLWGLVSRPGAEDGRRAPRHSSDRRPRGPLRTRGRRCIRSCRWRPGPRARGPGRTSRIARASPGACGSPVGPMW